MSLRIDPVDWAGIGGSWQTSTTESDSLRSWTGDLGFSFGAGGDELSVDGDVTVHARDQRLPVPTDDPYPVAWVASFRDLLPDYQAAGS
jgi:hypothetical protein